MYGVGAGALGDGGLRDGLEGKSGCGLGLSIGGSTGTSGGDVLMLGAGLGAELGPGMSDGLAVGGM